MSVSVLPKPKAKRGTRPHTGKKAARASQSANGLAGLKAAALAGDEAESFEHLIDAVHTAMMVYEEDGACACDVFLRKSGLETDGAFKACLQALLNAIPRARVKGKFVRPFVFRPSSVIAV